MIENRFPTAGEIAKAHAELGIDPNVDPCCDRCGAPITTGVMALICPYEKRCEFWTEEIDTLRGMMGERDADQPSATHTEAKP